MKSALNSLFLPTAVYYALTFLAPNKVSFVVLTVVYLLAVWRMTKEFRVSLAAVYLALFPFVMGKTFEIELVSARELATPWRPFGISADVLVSFQDATVLLMAAYLGIFAWGRRFHYVRSRVLEFFLFLYPAGTMVATYVGSMRPEISFLHALFALKPIIVFYFFASIRNFSVRRVLGIFAAGMCLEAVMVVGQIVVRGPVGVLIEPINNYIVVDGSREVVKLIRYGGTYMHANALANGLLIPLSALFPLLMYPQKGGVKLLAFCFMLGFGTFAMSMSRSAWVSFGAGLAVCVAFAWYQWRYRIRIFYPFGAFGRWVTAVFIVLCGIVAAPRIMSSVYTMDAYGSVETRVLLLREYGELLKAYPIFGVGLEMDVYTGYMRSLVRGDPKIDSPNRSVLQYFPEPVHNGIFRLIVQTGFIVTGIYIGLLGMLFHAVLRHMRGAIGVRSRLISLSLLCMFIATLVNSMMQPILPDIALLTALVGIYMAEAYEHA